MLATGTRRWLPASDDSIRHRSGDLSTFRNAPGSPAPRTHSRAALVYFERVERSPDVLRLFFSYSHRDEQFRDELEVHLSPLKREGIIATWHDRRIAAGDEFDRAISDELETADIILLLVSPYFLASDYCHDVELRRALERHSAGQARVIPVILQPCDWKNAPFGKLLAVPTDGKPISKYSNLHDAYLEVVTAVRQAVRASGSQPSSQTSRASDLSRPAAEGGPRSSNLRVVKVFSDHERDEFRYSTFEYLANYFESSLQELGNRNSEIRHSFRRVDKNTFTAAVYAHGTLKSACQIAIGRSFGDFSYSIGETNRDGSCNGWLSIEHDGHTALLRPGGMAMRGAPKSDLTQEGAAEYFWSIFIEPLQRR